MIDSISKIYNRLRPARNVSEALKQIVSPRLVDRLSRELPATALLPEQVADELFLDKRELLIELSRRLELPHTLEVRTPSTALVQRLGRAVEFLRDRWVVPQLCPLSRHGYRLLIADTEGIDVEAFQQSHIPVNLTLASLIEEAWNRFNGTEDQPELLGVDQINRVLSQLASDAEQLGADFVTIGSPDVESYECHAGAQRYAGKIHRLVIPSLFGLLGERSQLELSSNDPQIRLVRVQREDFRNSLTLRWEAVYEPTVKQRKPEIITASSSPTALSMQPPQSTEAQKKILLVDDDRHFSLILQKILENKNWEVKTASHGMQALEVLSAGEFEPDLIISDVHMPQCDGPQLVRTLYSEGSTLPILMLTSDEDVLLEAELAGLGAAAFVRKQSDPRILLAWCYNLLDQLPVLAKAENWQRVA